MAIHTAIMSDSFSTPTRKPGFLPRLILFCLFVAGIDAIVILLSMYQVNRPPVLMMLFANSCLGLAAGSGARSAFYQRSGFTRNFTTLVILTLGLYALGYFTNWKMGIGPVDSWMKGYISLVELAQIDGSALVAMVALWAWWPPPSRVLEDQIESYRPPSRREQARPIASVQSPGYNRPRLHFPESWKVRSQERTRLKSARRAKTQNRLTPEVEKAIILRPAKSARAKHKVRSRSKPDVQFSAFEEHRCPYCLDEVKRNDPRGVKECDICHSLHHGDCWEITGSCQVPHLNT
jgi:ribosomal protein L37AE/L43A